MTLHRHGRWLWRELWSRRANFLLALACTLASTGLYVLMPAWASSLVGDVLKTGGVADLALHLLYGLGLFFAASLLGYGRTYLMTRLSFLITADVRSRLFSRILQASPRRLASMGGGQLLSSFSNDLGTFQEALVRVVAVFAPSVLMFVAFAGAMAWYSWVLFLCTVVLVSPLALITSYFGRKLHGAAHVTQDSLAGLTGNFEEMLAGVKEIKAFNREQEFVGRFDALNERTLASQLRREGFDAFHPVAVSIAAGLGLGGMTLLSAFLLDRGLIDAGTLTAFLVCVGLAYSPLQEASHTAGRLIQLGALLDRFERILELPAESGGTRALAGRPVEGALSFEDVSFAYEAGSFRLDNFSLDIPAGHKVALVGPSGGGKSTIIDLVPRFLSPDGGRILLDGTDIAELPLDELRKQIGVVFQQPVLFEGSVLDNIRFGAPDAPMEDVLRAAEAAHVDDFVQRLPGGYEARLDPAGRNLSVGQRQRIAIARVFLRNPRILLLDEPTSALDAESEGLVRDALERAAEGRTAIIVAHRLSTIRAADSIVVVEGGRIVEMGSHGQLLRRKGLYHRLSAEQFQQVPAE
ncbi:MAG: ABC transporter ATP-binding protein [Rhizobiaceae bacterium]|nr:ABC transporter ATP-binding protein [Rhizobiaceae bacterium]